MFYSTSSLHQLQQEGMAQITANNAQSQARRARSEVEALEFDVERLLMITEALWEILKEQHGYNDHELIRRVSEIDLRDGRLDGKVAKDAPSKCPHCNRTLQKNRPLCLFCGKPVAQDPFQR